MPVSFSRFAWFVSNHRFLSIRFSRARDFCLFGEAGGGALLLAVGGAALFGNDIGKPGLQGGDLRTQAIVLLLQLASAPAGGLLL